MSAFRSIEIVTPPDITAWLEALREFMKAEHLRYNEGTAEDNIILQQLATALEMFEDATNGRVVLSTTFNEYNPCWSSSCRPMRLSKAKVTSVDGVSYYDVDDE